MASARHRFTNNVLEPDDAYCYSPCIYPAEISSSNNKPTPLQLRIL